MGKQIIKQPNGRYLIYSTVVDDIIACNGSREDVIEYFAKLGANRQSEIASETLDSLDKGGNPYFQFKLSWDEVKDKMPNGWDERVEPTKVTGLDAVGEWLNSKGYGIDLSDPLWMEDFIAGETSFKDLSDLIMSYSLECEKQEKRKLLCSFKNWWNELDDELDDKLYMTDETISAFLKSNSV